MVAIFATVGLPCGSALGRLQAAAPQTATAPSADLETLEVRPSFFVIAGAGSNIGVQVGEDGVVVVDTGRAAGAPAILAQIRRISQMPIRYIIVTGPDADHVGGNEALAKAGEHFFSNNARNAGNREAPILSITRLMRHLKDIPRGSWPTEVFDYPRKAIYVNGEAIEVLSQPPSHTDSDAFVFFRRSDVVMAGDVLDTRQFPVIDVERGGSIEGEIAALNRLVELAVPSVPVVSREAGTIVIPGHGRLCDQYDVIEYRDMLTIIRDRVRDLIEAGRSLAQVQAAQPAKGYTARYGNAGGSWTTERFIEAVYKSLPKEKP
jgi:cyclase